MFYGDDDDCRYGGIAADEAAIYDPGLRNPYTGECEYYGGGSGGCDDRCGPCPAGAEPEADRAPTPTWGYCEGHCTGLDEETCIDTGACRAIYAGETYHGCWATDQTGPIQGGGCDGLDAFVCSQHDDCSAVHAWLEVPPGDGSGADAPEPGFTNTVGPFERCIPEKGSCEGAGCGDPGSCEGEAECDALPPECPTGTAPGIVDGCWSGYCIPLADCGDGDPDPGTCYGEVVEGEVAPECPAGTTPGIAQGYYTGYCIPLDRCEAAPACSEIQAEATCIAREDCTALYQGVGCECVGDACSCDEWVWTSCE